MPGTQRTHLVASLACICGSCNRQVWSVASGAGCVCHPRSFVSGCERTHFDADPVSKPSVGGQDATGATKTARQTKNEGLFGRNLGVTFLHKTKTIPVLLSVRIIHQRPDDQRK